MQNDVREISRKNSLKAYSPCLTFLLGGRPDRRGNNSDIEFHVACCHYFISYGVIWRTYALAQWPGVAMVAFGICAMEAPGGAWRKIFGPQFHLES
jgi:hypothetical protein